MQLYTYFRSSAAWRVRIALALKGLDTAYRPVHLVKKTSSCRESPTPRSTRSRLVPTLRDGDATLARRSRWPSSGPFDETHPNPPLLPATPLERARVRALALDIACEVHPLNNLRVLRYLEHAMHQSDAARDAVAHIIGSPKA